MSTPPVPDRGNPTYLPIGQGKKSPLEEGFSNYLLVIILFSSNLLQLFGLYYLSIKPSLFCVFTVCY